MSHFFFFSYFVYFRILFVFFLSGFCIAVVVGIKQNKKNKKNKEKAKVIFVVFVFFFFVSVFWFCMFLALPIPTRVKDLISRMTISEKVNNLGNSNNGVSRLGVPPNQFSEALHGVSVTCGATNGNNTGCPTSFPHALLMSASFNRTLWQTVGKIISTEARGLNNQGVAGLYFCTPDINLFRDPRFVLYESKKSLPFI